MLEEVLLFVLPSALLRILLFHNGRGPCGLVPCRREVHEEVDFIIDFLFSSFTVFVSMLN